MGVDTIISRSARLLTAGALALTLEGCITTSPFTGAPEHPFRTLASITHQETTTSNNTSTVREPLFVERKYSVERITIPENEQGPTTVIDYYRSNIKGPRPLILMSPPLGTSKPGAKLTVEKPFLSYFAKAGFDAALIYRPRIDRITDDEGKFIDPIGDLENGLALSVRGYRKAVTFLEREPNILTNRLCALGISMGGIVTTISAGSDARIRYTIIALAGSTDLVLKHATEDSDEGLLRKIAREFERYGGRDGFLAQAEKRITYQPQRFAHGVDPSRTMLIISKRDKIIPFDAAQDLRARMGKPSTRYVHLLGHIGTFLLYPVLRNEALEFYRARIAADDLADMQAEVPTVPLAQAVGGGGGKQ